MRDFLSALNSGIGRRLLGTQSAVIGLVFVAAVMLVGWRSATDQERWQLERLDQAAMRVAAVVDTRLAAADAIATALVASGDSGQDGAGLRRRLAEARAFRSVQILSAGSPERLSSQLDEAERDSILAGGSALLFDAAASSGLAQVYLARATGARSTASIALFELSPEWLWSPVRDLAPDTHLFVYGTRGELLFDAGGTAPELSGLFASELRRSLRPGARRMLSGVSGSEHWSGALAALPLRENFSISPLAVVAADQQVGILAAMRGEAVQLLPLAGLAFLLVLAVSAVNARRYVPMLSSLGGALDRLAAGDLASLPPAEAGDEVQDVVRAFNVAARRLHDERSGMRALAEVDALLLNRSEVEAVLDSLLSRIREVTGCRGVGITLVDADSHGHGRLFVVGRDGGCEPVRRVLLDPEMSEVLAASEGGLTIARCEEVRHSFLAPMLATGSQFFWVWPVFADTRLAAILSLGYADAEQLEERVAAYGTACAERLGLALSASARTEALYRRAHFDPLTQLPNRLLFRDRLTQELAAVADGTHRGALLYIDLDHFKKVNDSLGHDAGDQLLAITAQRLRGCVKDGDTVARLAGDEFTVILRQVADPAGARAVAERVIQSLQMPVNIGGRDHQVRASIGVTLFPDDGSEIDELLRNADLAMYRAKQEGRAGAVFFERRMSQRLPRVADSGLHRALKRREFSLFYQPQFSLVDGRLLGVEALLRWQTPRDGLRGPDDFVPAAEESGLIVDIGSWVLEAALAQVAQWRDLGLVPPRMAINVSVGQLRDPGLAGIIRRQLDRHGLPADCIELEFKEAAFTDPEARASIEALTRMGLRLTLDDYGTGYTALTQLRGYPVHTVKIDRSFVDAVPTNAASAKLAETIIEMAHALGKQVVAEGVETVEQLDFLRERRCDVVQGYYLARPLTVADMSEMLHARLPSPQQETAASA
jgi:diguanylate cyclase (GGDEF)-like protein